MRHALTLSRRFAAVVALACLAGGAQAQDLFSETGRARALEGDTLVVNDRVISLYGIDAPLKIQPCFRDGQPFPCGLESQAALEALLATGPVVCEQFQDTSFRRRFLNYGKCTIEGVDISAEMVRQGMAMAFPEQSDAYLEIEQEAKAARAGHWNSQMFEPPWEWEENARTQ